MHVTQSNRLSRAALDWATALNPDHWPAPMDALLIQYATQRAASKGKKVAHLLPSELFDEDANDEVRAADDGVGVGVGVGGLRRPDAPAASPAAHADAAATEQAQAQAQGRGWAMGSSGEGGLVVPAPEQEHGQKQPGEPRGQMDKGALGTMLSACAAGSRAADTAGGGGGGEGGQETGAGSGEVPPQPPRVPVRPRAS